jgi:hypothetical protein
VATTADLEPGQRFHAALTVRAVRTSQSGESDDWATADLGGNWTATPIGVDSAGSADIAAAGEGQLGMTFAAVAKASALQRFGVENRVRVEYALRQASLVVNRGAALPVLVSRVLSDHAGLETGDFLILELGNAPPQRSQVVGVVDRFPTVDPDQPLIVADLPTVSAISATATDAVSEPNEWWLHVAAGSDAELAQAVRAEPITSPFVLDLEERTRSLETDPLALGVIGALTLGFLAAALFAAIGFAVSAAVSTRERLAEFAVLRALGLSPRQLGGWLAGEHLLLVGVSLLSGTGVGLLLGWLVLPFATMRRDPGPVVPPPEISVPWSSIALLLAGVVVVVLDTVAALVAVLRRVGLGSTLRLGED